MKALESKPIYCKPCMLPESIAFEVRSAERLPNKTDTSKVSNVLFLKYKRDVVLQFYGDSDFQKFTKEEIDEYNEALKTEKWFVVSYGKLGTNIVTKQLEEAKVKAFKFEVFNCKYICILLISLLL